MLVKPHMGRYRFLTACRGLDECAFLRLNEASSSHAELMHATFTLAFLARKNSPPIRIQGVKRSAREALRPELRIAHLCTTETTDRQMPVEHVSRSRNSAS